MMNDRSGGIRLRLLAGAGAITLVAAACGGSTPSATAPASAPPAATTTPSGSGGGSPSAATGDVDLFTTTYAPDAGQDGGTAIMGDWQEATQFNPYYLTQVSEANVASAAWSTLVTLTSDYKYAPDLAVDVPTLDNGGVKVPGDNGDAMSVTWKLRDGLKWSDGKDITCDDVKYAREWVMDPANVGVIVSGWEDLSAIDCPSATDIVMHY